MKGDMMKKTMTLLCFAALLGAALPGVCSAQWLPEKKAFKPFMADQTYPSFGARLTGIVGSGKRAEVNMGDEFGIVALQLKDGATIQFGAMGGVAARFNISQVTNDFEVADFSLAFPVDYINGLFGLRAMYWHTSSHLGDDFIKSNGILPGDISKHVTDDLRVLASYQVLAWLRVYGGAGHAFNLIPDTSKNNRLHSGFEASRAMGRKSVFLASDLQAVQRFGWNPSFTGRVGGRYAGDKSAVSGYVEFFSGRSLYLGLAGLQETHWSLGFTVEM